MTEVSNNEDPVELPYEKHYWASKDGTSGGSNFNAQECTNHPSLKFELSGMSSEKNAGSCTWEDLVHRIEDGPDDTVRRVLRSSRIEFMIFDQRLLTKLRGWIRGRDRGLHVRWGYTLSDKCWRWIFEVPIAVRRFLTQKREWLEHGMGDMRGVVVSPADYRTIKALFLAGKLTSRRKLEKVLEGMDVLFRY